VSGDSDADTGVGASAGAGADVRVDDEADVDPLSVVVVTVQEYYYIPRFLRSVLASDAVEVVEILTMPPSLGTESTPRFALDLLRRFGPRVFAQHVAFYAKYATLDAVHRVTGTGEPFSARTLAARRDIDHEHVTDVNDPSVFRRLTEREFDVLVSVAATQKFEPDLLATPNRCAVNVHSSLLPEYRGVSPSFWTLLRGEDRTGITVHYMDEGLDTGAVIAQEPLPIREGDTLHSLNARVAERGSEVLLDALEQVRAGTVTATPIDAEEGSYFSLPEGEDVRAFRRRGREFY